MASESDSTQGKVSMLIFFPHDIVLIVAGGQPVAIEAPERHWYRLWIRGKQPRDPIPMAGHNEKNCPPKKWSNKKCEHYPYRHNPGCARWVLVLSTLVVWAALGASIFALVRGWPFQGFWLPNDLSLPSNIFVHVGNKTYTPPPIDPNDPKSTLLVYALIFRSAPTYIAGIFVTTIIESVDLNMRFMQPFLNMFKKPAEADQSILLSYITLSPLQVPLTAYDKKHYKVSWYSTLNTISPLFPIFVGGLLTVSGDKERVTFDFSLSAYIGIMVSLILYSISLPWAFPHPHRLLPRQFYSMADLMAFCHQARFLGSPYLNIADPKRTPTKEHMEARIRLSGDRFLFGSYYGRDKKSHLGFDVEESRAQDFGPIQTYHQVEPITPEGYHWLMREKAKVATLKARTFIESLGPGGGLGRTNQGNYATGAQEVHDENGTSIRMSDRLANTASAQTAASSTGSDHQQGPSGRRERTIAGSGVSPTGEGLRF
jgi:Protein of unknown function (DUF3433)